MAVMDFRALEQDAALAAKSKAAKDVVAGVKALRRLPRRSNSSYESQQEQSRQEENKLARSIENQFKNLPEAVVMYLEKLAQDEACDLLRQLRIACLVMAFRNLHPGLEHG